MPAGELVYDLERRCIEGLLPRESVLPVLALGLEVTGWWEQREHGLWLKKDYLPPKQDRWSWHFPPPTPNLTPDQQKEEHAMIEQGMSLTK